MRDFTWYFWAYVQFTGYFLDNSLEQLPLLGVPSRVLPVFLGVFFDWGWVLARHEVFGANKTGVLPCGWTSFARQPRQSEVQPTGRQGSGEGKDEEAEHKKLFYEPLQKKNC